MQLWSEHLRRYRNMFALQLEIGKKAIRVMMFKELFSLPHAILWPKAFVCLPTYCDYAPKYRGLTVGQLVKMPARRTAAGGQGGQSGRCRYVGGEGLVLAWT